MLVLVKVLDILTKNSSETERTKLGTQFCGGSTECVVLEPDGEGRDDGDDEEPQGVAVTVVTTLVRIEL